MATQLQLRRGTTSENASFTGAVGEVTVDTTKDTLIVQDGSTAGGHELAKADGTNISFGDNVKATFGASDDLQIYHDGSNSYIQDSGSGNLRILVGDLQIRNYGSNENVLTSTSNAEVALYHNASQKLATTDTGIDVTGTATMDGLTVDGLAQISAQTNGAYALRVGDAAGSSGSVVGIGKIGINPQAAGTFTYTGTEIRATENAAGDYRAHLSFHTRGSGSDVEPLKRLDISNNGDISFYEDTGTTPKLFWDASAESLGIGGGTIASKLFVNTDAVGDSYFKGGADNSRQLDFTTFATASPNAGHQINATSINGVITLATGGTERMRIDSSGKVGIGTDSPSGAYTQPSLHIHATGNGSELHLTDVTTGATSSDGMSIFQYANDGYIHMRENGSLRTYVNGSERMRIDALGNASFNTTSISPSPNNVFGTALLQYGGASMSRINSTTLDLNRSTSDGAIIQFRKNGAGVGSIGTELADGTIPANLVITGGDTNASRLWLKGGDSGLMLDGHTNSVLPTDENSYEDNRTDLGSSDYRFKDLHLSGNVSAGAAAQVFTLSDRGYFVAGKSDSSNQHLYLGSYHGSTLKELVFSGSNASLYPKTTDSINLGLSTHKFQDLYLSGGVYLGGTGADNKLDDYEEGTWTPAFSASTTAPTIAYSSQSGTYVKIGAYVYCEFVLILSSFSGGSGYITFTGLPFATQNNDIRAGMTISYAAAFANGCNGMLINSGSTTSGILRKLDENNNLSSVIDVSELNGNELLRGSISYKAA